MVPYVVRRGEYLELIAHRMGFDADAVWRAPENAELRGIRPDHNILATGDLLYVPKPPRKEWLPLKIGVLNTFVASLPTVPVSVKLAIDGKPCSNESYVLSGGGSPPSGTTGGDGAISFTVPVTLATPIDIVLVAKNIHFQVRVGHLDPIATDSGVLQRLSHLGCVPRGSDGHDPGVLSTAIAQFQTLHNLPATGNMDDATRSALTTAHGS